MKKLLFCLLCFFAVNSQAATLFYDGFEGTPSPQWDFTSAPDGRATITTNFGPSAGTHMLVLDDAIDDANYSLARAMLSVNLENRRNVVLSFDAKSLGNEPDYGNERTIRDAVLISGDGGLNWRMLMHLGAIGETWENFSFPIENWFWWNFPLYDRSNVKILFACYENAGAPFDGIAIDEVLITGEPDQRAVIETPHFVTEGSASNEGRIYVSIPPSEPLTLQLAVTGAVQVIAPPTVTIPAGQTSANFQFSTANDSELNLAREITFFVSGVGIETNFISSTVLDDETAIMSLQIPSRLKEGETGVSNAVVRLSRAPSVPWEVHLLEVYPPGAYSQQLALPWTAVGRAGEAEAVFSMSAYNDDYIEEQNLVEARMKASLLGFQDATATTLVEDNETRSLNVSINSPMREGASFSFSVGLSGNTLVPVTITISGDGQLEIPGSVVISAYSSSAYLSGSVKDNAVRDGRRQSSITVSAPGFEPATAVVEIEDDEVPAYALSSLLNVVRVGVPFQLTVTAVAGGNDSSYFYVPDGRRLDVSIVLPDNTTIPASPSQVFLTNSYWSGEMTIPDITNAPIRLRFSDGVTSVESAPLDLMRVLPIYTLDLAWDPLRSRIYASTAAGDPNRPNQVIAIDPLTGTIVDSLTIPVNPNHLALTSGQEYLFVASDVGTIIRIDLSTFTVTQNFELGTNGLGRLYANDMATVNGRPDLLVVSRRQYTTQPFAGVVVFRDVVQLPGVVSGSLGANIIEPSSDPTMFFGLSLETAGTFYRLRVGDDGISLIDSTANLFSMQNQYPPVPWELKSEGDYLGWSGGSLVNGAEKKLLGNFPIRGPLALERSLNRVYFLEFSSQNSLGAYDAQTLKRLRGETLPVTFQSATSLLRWGRDGFAFASDAGLAILQSPQIVPFGPPADLSVTLDISPTNAVAGDEITFTVRATNNSANPARNIRLMLTFEGTQIRRFTTTDGQLEFNGHFLSASIPNLADHSEVMITVVGVTDYPRGISAEATMDSSSPDPNSANNSLQRVSSAGFKGDYNTFRSIYFNARSIVADHLRGVLWVAHSGDLFDPGVVSLNPYSGHFGELITLETNASVIALSKDARYLFAGLEGISEIHRIDLATHAVDLRIPLGTNSAGPLLAEDIETLDDSSSSILVTLRSFVPGFGSRHQGIAVFDGALRRGSITSNSFPINGIKPTASPGVFVGVDRETGFFRLAKLLVSASGVQVTSVNNIAGESNYSPVATGNTDTILASNGSLIAASTLQRLTNFGSYGFPLIDAPNDRAFLFDSYRVLTYELSTRRYIEQFAINGGSIMDVVRFGDDGFAILGSGWLGFLRWSLPFANSVGPFLRNPEITAAGGLRFVATIPQIAGAAPYQVMVSNDLNNWTPLAGGSTPQLVNSTNVNGFVYETMRYTIPDTSGSSRYFRLSR